MSKFNDIAYTISIKFEDGMIEDIYVQSSAQVLREVMHELVFAKEIKIKKENY